MCAASSKSDSLHIAVLDDNCSTCLVVQRLLERRFGCQVAVYANSPELFAGIAAQVPDLFLLDVLLGEESGIEVCRRLKSAEATRHVPVIFFSEHHQAKTRVEALRAGGEDYVDKPFYPEEFLMRVQGCLERFQRQRLVAKQAREQQALLRVLCHDLRNSVGASWSMLQQLRYAANAEELADYVKICGRAISSALQLIAHVGEYRSLMDGDRPFKVEVVDVASACDESRNLLGPAAAAKNITLRINVIQGLTLVANRVVLVHNIINNLLTNAVKFSPRGATIWIDAARVATDEGEFCCITVQDEGIGIPPTILQTLLKNQMVASRPGTAHEEGTGIGMTLVQLYVERSGGRMTLESQCANPAQPNLATGTTVRLWLPCGPL
jgi:two-component system sensor histidine kinase/response regulator